VISIGILLSKRVLTTITFAQNIVIGGIPPKFLITTAGFQKTIMLDAPYFLNLLTMFKTIKSDILYISKKHRKVDKDPIIVKMNHPLVLREDNPMIDSILLFFLMFLIGLIRDTTANKTTPH